MTQIQDKTGKERVIPILPEELEEFENEVERFQAGEWNSEHEFMAFRLRQGVYGQRQADVHGSPARWNQSDTRGRRKHQDPGRKGRPLCQTGGQ